MRERMDQSFAGSVSIAVDTEFVLSVSAWKLGCLRFSCALELRRQAMPKSRFTQNVTFCIGAPCIMPADAQTTRMTSTAPHVSCIIANANGRLSCSRGCKR